MEFKDKFIAFVDILGFTKLVEAADCGTGITLDRLLEILARLGSENKIQDLNQYGPTTCPESSRLQNNLDFCITQVSDSAIVSSEVSPAGLINLIYHCFGIVLNLLQDRILCRGYITRGRIYHTDNPPYIIGVGYQTALDKEKKVAFNSGAADKRATPFVEVDPAVCKYLSDCGDRNVIEMFSRVTRTVGENTALFPFQRLQHTFPIQRDINADKEKIFNQNVRVWIEDLKERIMSFVDTSDPSAVRKVEHYVEALNNQLAACDRTDEIINSLIASTPRKHN